ncbi:GNAT family N-acetyltransferase [Paenibacillus nasutitermitis]|uniref:Streptothricin acetyltransferase n=1 Tax=Paenibacillus nasutitermitis TaxID=1652958 RepID=A0A916ZHJ3_9BACL|nr:GNAT family N-acetyltransferase [Paenibacillus nasutitermitis]GGD96497.1 streptothricin acetyltransferase [Paenibacillus nasutitermitis]
MDIVIRKFAVGDKNAWGNIDDSFTVDSTLVLSLSGREFRFTVEPIPGYTKSYSEERFKEAEDEDYSDYIDSSDRIVYLAWAENQVVGRIVLTRNWNKYALVEDIAVDKNYRGHGVGRKLIERAKRWAVNGGMPGIMLETQSNNVNACQFYKSCGFVIGGLDLHLYQGIDKSNDEIAIFWYLIFE